MPVNDSKSQAGYSSALKTYSTEQATPTLQHCTSYKRSRRGGEFSKRIPHYIPFRREDKHRSESLPYLYKSMPSMTPSPLEIRSLSHSTSDIENFKLDDTEVDAQGCTRRKVDYSRVTLNDLEYVQMIGTGMYSKVYLVRAIESKEHFALKVMPKYKAIKKRSVPIKTEAEIMLSFDHPLVVKTWNTFEDEKNFYMLMNFAAGGELFYHLRGTGRFDEDTARFYAAEVVLALEYLHNHNIAYRDLKLENLVLSPSGHIQLTDFGFAKCMEDPKTFTLCGTPEYLAPEIIRGNGYTLAVDWWALGVLLFEMLAGYSPFYSDTPLEIYKNILRGSVRFSSCMSETAIDLLKGLLSRDVTSRLGMVQDGKSELRNHPFFAGVDWNNLHKETPPIKPSISGSGDAKYFQLDEEEEHTGADVHSDDDTEKSSEESEEESFSDF